ncbi:hypothetical protein ABIF97_008172 [Bradyrhizobium japonicum]
MDRATPNRLKILGMVARIVFAANACVAAATERRKALVLCRPEIFSNLAQGFRRLVRLNS